MADKKTATATASAPATKIKTPKEAPKSTGLRVVETPTVSDASVDAVLPDPDVIYSDICDSTDLGDLARVCRDSTCPIFIVARPEQVEALGPDRSRPIMHGDDPAVLCIWNMSEIANDASVQDLRMRLEETYATIQEPKA